MKPVFYISILLFVLGCRGQNKSPQEEKKTKQDSIMETFDIKTFNKKSKANTYSFENDEGDLVTQFGNSKNGYVEKISIPNEKGFEEYKEYYPSGNLHIKGKIFVNDFAKGAWKYYSNEGVLEKTVDYDKPFKFNWESIKTYLKEQHQVKDFEKDVISIRRFNEPESTEHVRKGPYWEIEYKGDYKKQSGQFYIELDGITGEELLVKKFKGKGALGTDATIALYDIIYDKDSVKEKN